MSGAGRWSDLTVRVGSAVVMVAVGFGAIYAGGDVFHVFVALICGAMTWELVRMLEPDAPAKALQLGALATVVLLLGTYLPTLSRLPLLLAPALVGSVLLDRNRVVFTGFAVLVTFAGYEMMVVRDSFGIVWLLWLALVVVTSDIAGYFAGKMFGGPKFWPRVSPKKTWSGTAAGWIGAGLIGLAFAWSQNTSLVLVPFSVLVAFAAQMGDIAESAIKRMVGAKDSSTLIPGHGGFLDRFDGMLGASVFVLLTGPVVGLSSIVS